MKSLKQLYRIGKGPSSSHTIGPERACLNFISLYGELSDNYKVILYGSLALTGVGHGTDKVIRETFAPKPVEIIFNKHPLKLQHPNTMDIFAYKNDIQIAFMRIYSIGGGAFLIDGQPPVISDEVYPLNTFTEIKTYCENKDIRLFDYVRLCEGKEIFDYLSTVWETMKNSIKSGLKASGILPGGLNLERKAKLLFSQHHIDESLETRENRLVCSYAYAVSEENASAKVIVTAPTCGASGVLPAVLFYMQKKHNFTDEQIINALASAGIIGNLIKTNASISGAECGCQAEIGSATSMASAALGELFELDLNQIEYAAEIAMEHQLGLTCDPVAGLVQIPCIERNAVAAMRAINATSLADFLSNTRKVSFDEIIHTMYLTGKDLDKRYRETSKAGLAKTFSKLKLK
jgi:L-serine dehydratase